MLINLKDLQGYALRATDGDIGTVKDFYFDDERWTVRYLVVECGSWLASRKVLITPVSIGTPNREDGVLPATISQAQVKGSPDIDTDQPVSRQHESEYLGYYGYPVYWGGSGLWGGEPFPGMMSGMGYMSEPVLIDPDTEKALAEADARRHAHDDPHLRSAKDVQGYHIKASDGEIGHVQGYIVDDQSWAIRYLVVDTSNWWVGHKVLIAPEWIASVSWEDSTVSVNLTQQSVKDSPAYDPAALPNREQEIGIYEHYQRPGYW
jgi:uncharacterized protein YrrD